MMGCGTSNTGAVSNVATPIIDVHHIDTDHSNSTQQSQNMAGGPKLPETLYDAYQRLDDTIYRTELLCPGPRLATVDAWIEHLLHIRPADVSHRSEVVLFDPDDDDDDGEANDDAATVTTIRGRGGRTPTPVRRLEASRSLDAERAAILRLAVQLNVALDVERARQNETHLADLSVRHLEHIARGLHADILGHTRQRAQHLLELYGRLKYMYDEQDGLLATVTSGSYATAAEERLDQRLDDARQVRDKLGAVAEQWRIAGNLLRTGAKEAIRASELWSLVALSKIATERLQLALDTQAASQAALVAIDYAHKSLPHVEFPHITRRRIVATRHACEYLLTDMADRARCAHTAAVLEAFRGCVEQTHRWLHDTFRSTLHVNLSEAEATVAATAKQLRAERTRYMAASEVALRRYVRPGGKEQSF